jgi:ribosomal-protein-alanine N-acetyltransferase
MNLKLTRLSAVDPADIVALHNDPRVIRHMPLAPGHFDTALCAQWVADKERQWAQNGYGPWAILIDGAFAGWGGLQLEAGDADIALVLFPQYWGYGRAIYREIIRIAFDEMGLESVTALLPPSRVRTSGMLRLGFQPDGELMISDARFLRYRLWSAHVTPR